MVTCVCGDEEDVLRSLKLFALSEATCLTLNAELLFPLVPGTPGCAFRDFWDLNHCFIMTNEGGD